MVNMWYLIYLIFNLPAAASAGAAGAGAAASCGTGTAREQTTRSEKINNDLDIVPIDSINFAILKQTQLNLHILQSHKLKSFEIRHRRLNFIAFLLLHYHFVPFQYFHPSNYNFLVAIESLQLANLSQSFSFEISIMVIV